MPAVTGADLHSRGAGLAWSYELDLEQLLAAIGGSRLGEAIGPAALLPGR